MDSFNVIPVILTEMLQWGLILFLCWHVGQLRTRVGKLEPHVAAEEESNGSRMD